MLVALHVRSDPLGPSELVLSHVQIVNQVWESIGVPPLGNVSIRVRSILLHGRRKVSPCLGMRCCWTACACVCVRG